MGNSSSNNRRRHGGGGGTSGYPAQRLSRHNISSARNSSAISSSINSSVSNEISSSTNTVAATALSRPGAYSVTRSEQRSQVFRVQIPLEVQPGQIFEVVCGNARTVRVRCPAESRGGNYLQLTVPPEPLTRAQMGGMAALTSVTGEGGGGAVRMN